MKKIVLIGISLMVIACNNSTPRQTALNTTETTEKFYGDKITSEGAVSINELSKLMGDKTEMAVKLETPVEAVCQKKGCWMDLRNADGTPMRVTFKDYAFFVPKDASGKTAIVEGVARLEETSVSDLKEYAKDAGKNEEEVEAIREPQKELVFEASGVILK